jgi:hypothetical protein
MNGVRNWAAGLAIAVLILLSPVIAFLMAIAVVMQIDLLVEAGTAADCTIAAGAIGWVLFRKYRAQPETPQPGAEAEPDEVTIAAPPV